MSALTDIFTSLANKIRTKLGTTTTYTPAQAIAAIDNVYNKGVTDTKKGDAAVSDVKSGKTFTSTNGVELAGTMPDNSTRTGNVPGISSSYPQVPTREGIYLGIATDTNGTKRLNICPPEGYYPGDGGSYVNKPASEFGNATTSQVLSSATFTSENGINITGTLRTQTKSTTSSRSAQTISPDNNYLLSSVSIAKYPDATGTYTYPANSTGATYDMGATNNLRYVNASNVYIKGRVDAHGANYYNASLPSGSTIDNMSSERLMLIMVESAGMSKPTVTNATWIFTLGYLNYIECHIYKPTGASCKVTTDGGKSFLVEVLS